MYTRDYSFPVYFEKAHHYYSPSAYDTWGTSIIAGLSFYICRVGGAEKGEVEKYIEAVSLSIPHIAATLNGCAFGQDDLARCEFAYLKADMVNAEKFAYQALYKSQKRKQYDIEDRALFFLLRLNLALGNQDKIHDILKLLNAQLEIEEHINRYLFYDIILGWFYAHIGQSGKIAPWLKNKFEDSEFNSFVHGIEILVRLKWHMSEKRYAETLIGLETCRDGSGNCYGLGAFLFGKVTLHIMEAVCRYYTGETAAALRAMETAYALAESNGLDMPFIEMGPDTRNLAEAALREGSAIPQSWLERIQRNSSAYGKKLLVTAERFRKVSEKPPILLVRREIKVLAGLSRGLTREDIAEEEGLSVYAVKGLIKTIYNKLGAVNRADAVRIATAMGILKNTIR